MKLYDHQEKSKKKILANNSVFNSSDPGTGKTISHLTAYASRKTEGKCLVLAPLSILESSWADDCLKATPELKTSIAYARNREQAFAEEADIYITNHDAIKWIALKCKETKGAFLRDFSELIIDEVTAFKNHTSARSKALISIRHHFKYRSALTGTPATQSLLDMWSMIFIIDDGKRLGDSYYKYRNNVAYGKQVGAHAHAIRWEDKPGARENISMQLADINIRYAKEDCLNLPEHNIYTVYTTLSKSIMGKYRQMAKQSVLDLTNGEIDAVNAAVRANKLLQICTGAIYDGDKQKHILHTERYAQVIELVKQREWPCVVAFNWRHEREELVKLANKENISYEIIDGTVGANTRTHIVREFQQGKIKMLVVHPQSAGHGLTLTRGKTTIWCSPTPNAEHFLQLNARIYRAGQTDKTETILIAARNTRELTIYDMLQGKTDRVANILDLLVATQEGL